MEIPGQGVELLKKAFLLPPVHIGTLHPGYIIKGIHGKILFDLPGRLLCLSHFPEQIGPKPTRLHIVGVFHQPFIHHLHRFLIVTAPCFNAGQIIEAHLLLLIGPGGLV